MKKRKQVSVGSGVSQEVAFDSHAVSPEHTDMRSLLPAPDFLLQAPC